METRAERETADLLCRHILIVVLICSVSTLSRAEEPFDVAPTNVALEGNFSQAQLLVSGNSPNQVPSTIVDLTHKVRYSSSDEKVAVVGATGQVLPRADGTARINVTWGEATKSVEVVVRDVVDEPVIDFLEQVRPALYKAGCNMGACHAAQHGQGGFKLSVFGFDPGADYAAIVREEFGRRINRIDPGSSLLLQKPMLQLPHGGGRRLEAGSRDFQLIRQWIRNGAPAPGKVNPIARLIVSPAKRIAQPGFTQQLQAEVIHADGRRRDITPWAKFDSMDEGIVNVTPSGLCTVTGRGQAAVMVRYEGQAEIAMFVVPYSSASQLAGWRDHNQVDVLASAKFRELGIAPSRQCDDLTFLRRVFLDASGTLPTRTEIDEFQKQVQSGAESADIRTRWIDRVLGLDNSPEASHYNERYAAYWTLKWSDLIRNNSRDLQEIGMWALHNWIKDAFRRNVSFDKFVSELVQGKGSNYSNGPANYFIVNGTPQVLAESTSQLFLGTRLTCAQCHHHPFEKYSEDDYYGFAAFFARTGLKSSQEFGMFGLERVVVIRTSGEVVQPRTRKQMVPKPLDAEPIDHPLDRRIALAQWMTSPGNPAFARATVNRYVSYLLGRGLVDPVDDMRSTNPPTNPALLNMLSEEFVKSGFDFKQLVRLIMTSRLYQLSSQPTAENAADTRFYSHFEVKRLTAEPLLDAIDFAAGTQTKFKDLPLGTRAVEIPDAEYPDYFLNTFAKPRRTSVCECERSPDANLAQALHTLNGDVLAAKVAAPAGRVAKLIADKKLHSEIVTELYYCTLCRPPSSDEFIAAEKLLTESPSPKECYEDLLWALINSKSFLFVH